MLHLPSFNNKGVSVIEILIVVAILTTALGAFAALLAFSLQVESILGQEREAQALARETMEATRADNATWEHLEHVLGYLEDAPALAFPSGMAAISASLSAYSLAPRRVATLVPCAKRQKPSRYPPSRQGVGGSSEQGRGLAHSPRRQRC